VYREPPSRVELFNYFERGAAVHGRLTVNTVDAVFCGTIALAFPS